MQRAQDEASLPMRMIIESAGFARNRAAAAAASAPPGVLAEQKRKSAMPTRKFIAQDRAPVAAMEKKQVATPPAPVPEPERTLPLKSSEDEDLLAIKPYPEKDVIVPSPGSESGAPQAGNIAPVQELDEADELVPLSQPTPILWSGFCVKNCNKFYFRVTFTVLPSGKVDKVKVIDTNRGMHSQAVMAAVSTWRYRPLRSAQEEEVLIRLVDDK